MTSELWLQNYDLQWGFYFLSRPEWASIVIICLAMVFSEKEFTAGSRDSNEKSRVINKG